MHDQNRRLLLLDRIDIHKEPLEKPHPTLESNKVDVSNNTKKKKENNLAK